MGEEDISQAEMDLHSTQRKKLQQSWTQTVNKGKTKFSFFFIQTF